MFHHASTEPRASPRSQAPCVDRLLVLAVSILASGCEDKALGRPCDLPGGWRCERGPGAPTTRTQRIAQATFAPNRPCSPAYRTISPPGPYCTMACNSDNDCNGQTRDFTNANDTRCHEGLCLRNPFRLGKLCCQKLCLCRDFFSASVGPAVPAVCQNNSGQTCS